MKKYTSPMASAVDFETADIITASFISITWEDFKKSDVDDESDL